jgi:hypothetical protein
VDEVQHLLNPARILGEEQGADESCAWSLIARRSYILGSGHGPRLAPFRISEGGRNDRAFFALMVVS